jgi:signal transduction histidine kinase/DNA-binding NarL/FixJ family response regulator
VSRRRPLLSLIRRRWLPAAWGRGSLAVRMLISVLVFSLLFAVLATGVQLMAEYRRQVEQIQLELDQIEHASLGGIGQALWRLDMQQNMIYLQGLHRLPNISALRLYFERDQLVAQVGELPWGADVVRRSMPIVYDDEVSHTRTKVGRLEVYATLDGVYRELWQQFAVILATQVLQAFAIGLCILLIFRHLVSRPLSIMAAYAKHMDLQHLDAPLVLPRRRSGSGDELDVLALAINTMRASIREDVAELNRLEAERAARLVAEANSQAKSEFLSHMSHELRTPLNAVLGYAQVLKHEAGLSPRVYSGLDTILQSGQHLLLLINDLLDLAKIEAGKLELNPEPTRLRACLAMVADIIRVRVEQKSLRFELALAADLPDTVVLDEKRLRQVLFNLLGNAVKFTDHGQVSLRVEVLHRDAERVRLRFEVADTGVGMVADQLSEIFQPFTQVGDTRRRAAGTGLGLAISRQLIELMGGSIAVSSESGAGSRFWFELNLILAERPPIAPVPAAPVCGYLGRRRRILVADDSIGNRAMLADWLDLLGFELAQADNGRQALEVVQAQAVDLVVMDLVMPEMDGCEAMRRIRALPGRERLPIIAFSANASEADHEASLQAGANAFLAKPLDEARFLSLLAKLLGLEWVHPEPAGSVPAAVPAAPLAVPPAAELAELYRLALAGSMRPIRQWAERIVELDESYRPFAERLQRMAQSYQSKAILELAESHLDPAARP